MAATAYRGAPGPYTANGTATVSAGQPATVQALDALKWQPNTLIAKPGATITIDVKNSGAIAHDFLSPALGVAKAVPLPAGQSVPITFTAPTQPGTYQFWCSVPGHGEAGMVGEVIVK
ncbi:MAG: cupredoxin domain-containing protein [Chloroflexota bacterium]